MTKLERDVVRALKDVEALAWELEEAWRTGALRLEAWDKDILANLQTSLRKVLAVLERILPREK